MRSLVNWKDHVVQYPSRFAETELGDNLVTLEPSPGTIQQQGTPQNAANFNTMDLAAFEAMLAADTNTLAILQLLRDMEGQKGVSIDASLTNTQVYPFNNSKKTIQITEQRNTTDYYVVPELLSASGGDGAAVGEFIITDKLLNGFKAEYTGSAASVSVRFHVIGGI